MKLYTAWSTDSRIHVRPCNSASEMTYIVSSGALNSTHSLTTMQQIMMMKWRSWWTYVFGEHF